MSHPLAIVLAAGQGTRMDTDLPKVLVPVLGRPMVRYVVDALREAEIEDIVLVVGYRADEVRAELADEPGLRFVEQEEQLGTGHAVMMAREMLANHEGPVVIVTGDSPLTQSSSLRAMVDTFANGETACLLGTAYKDVPAGLGRILRDNEGGFVGIVEEKDASEAERRITEVNMSTYVFAAADLLDVLDSLTRNNAQAEYYITDGPGILKGSGRVVRAVPVLKPCEALSINTLDELAAVEDEMRQIQEDR